MRDLPAILKDILDENTPLLPDSPLVSEVMAHGPGHAAGLLFRLLRTRPSEAATRNILPLFGALAERDDRWSRLLQKACTKRGRCPREHKIALRRALEGEPQADQDSSRVPSLTEKGDDDLHSPVTPLLVNTQARDRTIVLTTQSTSVEGIDALVGALAACSNARKVRIELPEDDHLYLGGLVTLATWRLGCDVRTEVVGGSVLTNRYLNKIGLMDVLQGGHPISYTSED